MAPTQKRGSMGVEFNLIKEVRAKIYRVCGLELKGEGNS